jgi:hypothetical protein
MNGDEWRDTYRVTQSERGTEMTDDGGRRYVVTLTTAGCEVEFPYFHGSALDYDADNALWCAARDCAGADECGSFEDFASDYGYDPDSLSAFRTYQTLRDMARDIYAWCKSQAMWEDFLSVGEEER